jgi:hypothetical protein
MREGGSPPPRFASLCAGTAFPAATSSVADVHSFRVLLYHVTLLVVNRLQLLLRVLCDR